MMELSAAATHFTAKSDSAGDANFDFLYIFLDKIHAIAHGKIP
jgi:hypothetical protein